MHRILLLVVLALLVIAMLVPETALVFLRTEYAWLGRVLTRVERAWPGVDVDHLIAFSLLGASAALALPRLGWRVALAALVVLAGVTELVQVWVPGRNPRVSDALTDVAGGLIGFTSVYALRHLLRRRPQS